MNYKVLGEISKPRQWKNLPISQLKGSGFPVYGANGIIGYYDEFNHENPTIAITCRGATCGSIHVTQARSYITSNAMAIDEVNENLVDLNYLAKYLRFRGLNDVTTGAAQPQITRTNLEKVTIPLPPLDDQKRIAYLLSKVEGLIAQRKQHLQQLDDLLKSVFLEMFGDPVRNEKGWDIIPLELMSEVQGGLQVTSKRESNPIEVPYLRVANVYRDRLNLTEIKNIRVTDKELERVRLKKGDILIVEGHGNPEEIGRSAVWNGSIKDCIHQNHLIRVRVNESILNETYTSYFINSPGGRSQMFRAGKTTSGLNTISSRNVKEIEVPTPPVDLQNQFTLVVEKVEGIKTRYQASLSDLENLYGALSQKAFKGELDLSRVPLPPTSPTPP
jgi:type I restriction enzyme S subunit